MRRGYLAGCLVGALLAAPVAGARAQTLLSVDDYPNRRPIRLIVPFAPGGSVDIASRLLATELSAVLGQRVVVENRPGAAGNIGVELASKAPADGYTLVVGSSSTFGVNPSLYKDLPYDALKDFALISLLSFAPNVLVVSPSVPARSVRELVALAKGRPGVLSFASSGSGGSPHLAGELFKRVAGIDIVHVPYKGTGQAMTDLLSGRVEMSFATVLAALEQISAGKLRALAVTSPKRVDVLPDVPTMAEAGFPEVQVTAWNGVLAPAGTPRPIIERLSREIRKVVSSPQVRTRLFAAGAEPVGSTPEEFARHIATEIEKWGRVVRAAGIVAN